MSLVSKGGRATFSGSRSVLSFFLFSFALIDCSTNAGSPLTVSSGAAQRLPLAAPLLSNAPSTPKGAPRETVLYHFQGSANGVDPLGNLVTDQAGALYGTTYAGGSGPSGGYGTVYKLTPSGRHYSEKVIYSFQNSPDGAHPNAGPIADATGALYGTTFYGGTGTGCISYSCGTVFKLTPTGSGYTESVIYNFHGHGDAQNPLGGLLADKSGDLYGTSYNGGQGGGGAVFKLTPSGSGYIETVLWSFGHPGDGLNPQAGLVADRTGALYGTTQLGGSGSCTGGLGCGTVFKLTPYASGYLEGVLYSFQAGSDGAQPLASVTLGKNHAIFGTTNTGGAGPSGGYGTIFALKPSGTSYTETILHTFQGGSDGLGPLANLTFNSGTGILYGTTAGGGGASACPSGCGTVFRLKTGGSGYAVLHSFSGSSDGAYPRGGMLLVKSPVRLYSTTGGLGPGSNGNGTVFKLKP
jgi:uncharacterized repeat protein (TIGR03803 family)